MKKLRRSVKLYKTASTMAFMKIVLLIYDFPISAIAAYRMKPDSLLHTALKYPNDFNVKSPKSFIRLLTIANLF